MLPSIPKIIYAVSTNVSIGALFVAGLLPGSLLTFMLCVVTWFLAKRRGYPLIDKAPWAETWRTFKESVWGIMLVVIIIGGILSGVFTATEAGAVACVYAFFVTMFVYRECKWRDLPKLVHRVVRTVGMVMIMIGFSVAFAYAMTLIQLPATGEEQALMQLEQLDQRSRILELGFDRIDLRNPELVAVRPRQSALTGGPAAAGA